MPFALSQRRQPLDEGLAPRDDVGPRVARRARAPRPRARPSTRMRLARGPPRAGPRPRRRWRPPATPRRPQRRAGRRHGAVAVAVGLDHRAQPRPLADRRFRRAALRAIAPRSTRAMRPLHSGSSCARASSTSSRVTTPTSRPCSTTGRRLCFLLAISRAASADGRARRDRHRVLGHQVAGLGGERLAQPVLEALQRLEEDGAAEELDVVRQVQVRALLARARGRPR